MNAQDRRAGLINLFDRARVNGVAYLFIICTLGSANKLELTEITREDESTFGKYLLGMESRGLLVRTRVGKCDRWFPTPSAIQQLHAQENALPTGDLTLLPKISVGAPSSSSDLIDQSVSDQIKSDQSEEEEAEEVEFKQYLCKEYGFTGDKARALMADKSIFGKDVCAWMSAVKTMKKNGFRFSKSPEAYALHCLLKKPYCEPNDAAVRDGREADDYHWRIFQQRKASLAAYIAEEEAAVDEK